MRASRGADLQDDDDEDGFVQAVDPQETEGDYDDYDADGEMEHSDSHTPEDGDWDDNGESGSDQDDSQEEGQHIEIEIHHSSTDDGNLELNIEVFNDNSGFNNGHTEIYIHHDDGEVEVEDASYGEGEEEIIDDDDSYDDGDPNQGPVVIQYHETEEEAEDQEEAPLQVIVNNSNAYYLDEYQLPPEGSEQIPQSTAHNRHQFEACSICLNSIFKKSYNSCYLECLHWYHFECLKCWCSQSRQCPVCRRDFINILKVK